MGVVTLLAVWEVWSRLSEGGSPFLPPPSAVGHEIWSLTLRGELLHHLGATLGRVGGGFSLALLLGLGGALLCHRFPVAAGMTTPVAEALQSLPGVALLPLFMLLFGIGLAAKVLLIAWVAWVPIFLSALEGMKSIDPMVVKSARSLGATPAQITLFAVLPAALPTVVTGLRLSVGAALRVVVPAEMLGANSGLGFMILEAAQQFRILDMYAALFALALTGMTLNGLLLAAARLLAPWQRQAE